MQHTLNESSSNYTDPDNNKESGEKEQLLEQHKVENTPFTIIKYGDHWFLAMGKYRLTEPAPTREEIEAQVHDVSWNRLMQIIMIVTQEQINNQNKPN